MVIVDLHIILENYIIHSCNSMKLLIYLFSNFFLTNNSLPDLIHQLYKVHTRPYMSIYSSFVTEFIPDPMSIYSSIVTEFIPDPMSIYSSVVQSSYQTLCQSIHQLYRVHTRPYVISCTEFNSRKNQQLHTLTGLVT